MTAWNEKYLLLFVKHGKYILLFNMLTGRIENKFLFGDYNLYCGKKLKVNNEELLFVLDSKGEINLYCCNQFN